MTAFIMLRIKGNFPIHKKIKLFPTPEQKKKFEFKRVIASKLFNEKLAHSFEVENSVSFKLMNVC